MTDLTPDRIRDIADLLAYCAAADPRFNTPDAEQARARVVAWADLLNGIPIDYARDRVRDYYRRDQAWPVTPGSIRVRWLREQAKASQPALVAHAGVPAYGVSPATRQLLDSAREQLRMARKDGGY